MALRLTERQARELFGIELPEQKRWKTKPPEPRKPYDPTWYYEAKEHDRIIAEGLAVAAQLEALKIRQAQEQAREAYENRKRWWQVWR